MKGGGSRPNYSGLNDQTTKSQKVENGTGRKFPPVENRHFTPPPRFWVGNHSVRDHEVFKSR